MALAQAYLISAKNLTKFLDAIRNAKPPQRFTLQFLRDLDFKSTNDRLFIPVLKALGFIDATGIPKQRYFDYLDPAQSKVVLAQGIKDAYEDLFRLNLNAQKLPRAEITGKLRSLTQGTISHAVLGNMVKTFFELAKHADFDKAAPPAVPNPTPEDVDQPPQIPQPPQAPKSERDSSRHAPTFSYRIEVVLPSSRDRAVYDAIFSSMRDHL